MLAGCSQPPNCPGVEGGGNVTVRVMDQQSGDRVCTGSVGVTCGSNHQTSGGCTVEIQTRYTGTCDVDVTAPGFAASHTKVDVVTMSCSSTVQPIDANETVQLAATCGNTEVHDDGIGDTWADCAPSPTIDETEAMSACLASGTDPRDCKYASCDAGDAGVGSLVCSGFHPGYCWCYAGPCAGYVLSPTVAMSCDIRGAPSWG